MTQHENPEAECCPIFDPEPWDNKEIKLNNKLFIRDTVPQLFHIPLPGTFGRAVSKMWQKIEQAGARPEDKNFLMLTSETSQWKGEIYISVTKEVPGAENVRLSGSYLTRVFDGAYNDVPKWIKEMEKHAAQKEKCIKNYYFYYTTCPRCAKKYGHNYTVVFAGV
ncbi:MAG: hypothetical protein PHF74_02980 [Dehalococcoidales bacterium]|nr:hypothetical protein [Dehalococcoidales bacterium]